MSPEATLQAFLEGFGIPVYSTAATPDDAEFPYMTYDVVLDVWGTPEVNVPVNLWMRTTSEAEPNSLVRAIGNAIGRGGVQLPCDGGTIWVKKGQPWAQAIREDSDGGHVKRRYININIEYNTLEV